MGAEILVSAAASLTDTFGEIGAAFTRASAGVGVKLNFGASGALAQQIRSGAPVDVFAAAAEKEMDDLAKAGRVDGQTRVNFASNRLVLIAPKSSRLAGFDGLRGDAVRRIALGQPDAVPAGRYAKETLTRRGLWEPLQKKLVFAGNVRQTLTYVAMGNADAGLVFATDARIEARHVRVVAVTVPGKDHSPILYPAAVIAGARNAEAGRRFVAFLRTPTAQAILKRYGFGPAPVA